jgi:hypothetical protein
LSIVEVSTEGPDFVDGRCRSAAHSEVALGSRLVQPVFVLDRCHHSLEHNMRTCYTLDHQMAALAVEQAMRVAAHHGCMYIS